MSNQVSQTCDFDLLPLGTFDPSDGSVLPITSTSIPAQILTNSYGPGKVGTDILPDFSIHRTDWICAPSILTLTDPTTQQVVQFDSFGQFNYNTAFTCGNYFSGLSGMTCNGPTLTGDQGSIMMWSYLTKASTVNVIDRTGVDTGAAIHWNTFMKVSNIIGYDATTNTSTITSTISPMSGAALYSTTATLPGKVNSSVRMQTSGGAPQKDGLISTYVDSVNVISIFPDYPPLVETISEDFDFGRCRFT